MYYLEGWEHIQTLGLSRLRVPNGWLVCMDESNEATWFPDAAHDWELPRPAAEHEEPEKDSERPTFG